MEIDGSGRPVTRRRVLLAFAGLGVVGVGGGAAVVLTDGPEAVRAEPGALTVDRWRAERSRPVLVAHRGSGDTLPEHTMEAYQAAADWGATAMEISVGITSDGVLICMHDATYDRTTTGHGRLDSQPVAVLETVRVRQPQLGAYWVANAPRVPLFEDVLERFGGRIVLCLEAKDRDAYEPMMAAVVRRGLQRSVMVKVHYSSDVMELAAEDGYPRFAYLGALSEVTRKNIDILERALDPSRDVMVISAGFGPPERPFVPDELVRAAVATGIPVWVFPLHRRSELQHFLDLGVEGAVCAGYGYLAGAVPPVTHDDWADERVAPGELSSAGTSPPTWTADGELVLDLDGRPHFVMPGQFCPVAGAAAGRWSIEVELRWAQLPSRGEDALSVAFGHEDDRSYEDGSGAGTGYHATFGADGTLGLFLHHDRQVTGVRLAQVGTPAPAARRWVRLRIDVTPSDITVRRIDTGDAVSVADATVRGGYLHLGRASCDGVAAFRGLTVG